MRPAVLTAVAAAALALAALLIWQGAASLTPAPSAGPPHAGRELMGKAVRDERQRQMTDMLDKQPPAEKDKTGK